MELSPIPDHVKQGLHILFVGFNPSIRSGETGHYFANPRNRFWNILFQAGLTPKLLKSSEDGKMLEYGYGLTNIVARPTKEAKDITKEEYDKGRDMLREKIQRYSPKVVCFVGKGVYLQYCKKAKAEWGAQPIDTVTGTKDFVAPSSSGLVRMKMNEIVAIYNRLHHYI